MPKKKGNKGGAFGNQKKEAGSSSAGGDDKKNNNNSSSSNAGGKATLTNRMAAMMIEAPILSETQISAVKYMTPGRPVEGSQGISIDLVANYFEIHEISSPVLFLYSIAVLPEAKGPKLRQIIKCLLDHDFFRNRKANSATDFSQYLISVEPLEDLPNYFEVPFRKELEDSPPDDPKIYKIKVEAQDTPSIRVSALMKELKKGGIGVGQFEFAGQPHILQALNILVGHHVKASPFIVNVGRNKAFSIDPAHVGAHGGSTDTWSLGDALQARRGFFSSVRAAKDRILLNVNTTSAAFVFPGQTLETLIDNYRDAHHDGFGSSITQEDDLKQLQKIVKGLRVKRIDVRQRKNKAGQDIPDARVVFGLADRNDGRGHQANPPRKNKFGADDQVEIWNEDMEEYQSVSKKYRNTVIRASNYPVVNLGNKEHPEYYPMTACMLLPGNYSKATLNSTQNKAMIDRAVLELADTVIAIEKKSLPILGLVGNSIPQSIPISVVPGLLKVSGRRLLVPTVKYKGVEVKRNQNQKGSWIMQGYKLTNSNVSAIRWALVRFAYTGSDVKAQELSTRTDTFVAELRKNGINLGSHLGKPETVFIEKGKTDTIGSTIEEYVGKKLQLLIMVLPEKTTQMYEYIKTHGEVQAGIKTACVLQDKFLKGDAQIFANLSLKINLKLGVNQGVDKKNLAFVADGKTMIVGYDVTHPAPGLKAKSTPKSETEGPAGSEPEPPKEAVGDPVFTTKSEARPEPAFHAPGLKVEKSSKYPSIAAMVASKDSALGQWPAIIRMQEQDGEQAAGQEMVIKLKEMLESRLDIWRNGIDRKENDGHPEYPENILIYRDGVSEGQYKSVIVEELPLLQAACDAKYKRGKCPRITLIIVGKRHHSRFLRRTGVADNVENPQFGTVVDNSITNDKIWDFFLQSHTPRKGTARPAHYIVLKDDIFSAPYRGNPKMQVHQLETVTNSLCQLNGRATMPVSLPPPAKYADMACTRARCYINQYFRDKGGMQIAPIPQASELLVQSTLHDSMFYI